MSAVEKPFSDQIILTEDPQIDDISKEDVEEYASQIGISLPEESELVWIARAGLQEPLPSNWLPVEDSGRGEVYYYNVETDKSTWEHPVDGFFRTLVRLERESLSKGSSLAEVPPLHSSCNSQESSSNEISEADQDPTNLSANDMANFRKSARNEPKSVTFDFNNQDDDRLGFNDFLDSMDVAHLSPILQRSPEPEDVNMLLGSSRLSDDFFRLSGVGRGSSNQRKSSLLKPLEGFDPIFASRGAKKVEVVMVGVPTSIVDDVPTLLSDRRDEEPDADVEEGELRLLGSPHFASKETQTERDNAPNLPEKFDFSQEEKEKEMALTKLREEASLEMERERNKLADLKEQKSKELEEERENLAQLTQKELDAQRKSLEQEIEEARFKKQEKLEKMRAEMEREFLKEQEDVRVSLNEKHQKLLTEMTASAEREHGQWMKEFGEQMNKQLEAEKKAMEESLRKQNQEQISKFERELEAELAEKKQILILRQEEEISRLKRECEERLSDARICLDQKMEKGEVQIEAGQSEKMDIITGTPVPEASQSLLSTILDKLTLLDHRLVSLEASAKKNSHKKHITSKQSQLVESSGDETSSASSEDSSSSYANNPLSGRRAKILGRARRFLRSPRHTVEKPHRKSGTEDLAKSVDELTFRLDQEAQKLSQLQKKFISKRTGTSTPSTVGERPSDLFPEGPLSIRTKQFTPSIDSSSSRAARNATPFGCWMQHQLLERAVGSSPFLPEKGSIHGLQRDDDFWPSKLKEMKRKIRSSQSASISFTLND